MFALPKEVVVKSTPARVNVTSLFPLHTAIAEVPSRRSISTDRKVSVCSLGVTKAADPCREKATIEVITANAILEYDLNDFFIVILKLELSRKASTRYGRSHSRAATAKG
jgi:hypothetical protein